MTKSKIIDRDLGYKDIMKRLRGLDGEHVVEVGVPADKGAEKKTATKIVNGKKKKVTTGVPLIVVASANEFGTDTIPERSYLRSTMDEKASEYNQLMADMVWEVLDGVLTMDQALDKLGLQAVADVQRKIVQLDDPPNAKATIERKKSSNPLIDTGQLRQSIIHRVNKPDE